jgi:hypothetical protein
VITTIALAALGGCGDAHTFKVDSGHFDRGSAAEVGAALDGADVQLSRYSTSCDAGTVEPLVAKVGDGVGFTGDQVKTLASPCLEAPSPAIEIQVERHSVVFDFSNVERAGTFPKAEFEGFLLDIAQDTETWLLVAAVVNRQVTNMDLENEDLSYDYDHLEVNFAGAGYDSNSFVKIDLYFVAVAAAN